MRAAIKIDVNLNALRLTDSSFFLTDMRVVVLTPELFYVMAVILVRPKYFKDFLIPVNVLFIFDMVLAYSNSHFPSVLETNSNAGVKRQ